MIDRPTRLLALVAALALTLTFAAAASAENWSHWRGPAWNGSSPETNLPTKFSQTENVKWSVDLPGLGASTPIIFGDHVFISLIEDKTNKQLALCLDRTTGKELWRDEVGVGTPVDNRANMAGPSPTTDGKTVVYFFGTGDLAGFTVEGKKLWQRSVTREYGEFAFQWTFSSSPTFYEGVVYLQVLQRNEPVHGRGKPNDESFILAMEPTTGKNIWRHVRPSKAAAESREAYSTILPYEHAGLKQLLVTGGDAISGHDPKTGKELWRWGTWNPDRIGHWRLVPSPVGGDGVALACAPKGSPIYAVPTDRTGDLSGSGGGLLWSSSDKSLSSDVSTPLFYDGDFFVLNSDRKSLARVKPKTGQIVWQVEKLPSRAKYEASPTGADGKLYVISHNGEAAVLDAKTGKVLHETNMGQSGTNNNRASVAVSQGDLFIKVDRKLYCVGE
jgi:outer membrane protein assembly factor BamB